MSGFPRMDPEPVSEYIQYWVDDQPPTHPIIDELRARPGAWAVLGHPGKGEVHGPEWWAAYNTCKKHPNIQLVGILEAGYSDSPIRARWLPDPVVAAIQVLKG